MPVPLHKNLDLILNSEDQISRKGPKVYAVYAKAQRKLFLNFCAFA